MNEIKTEKKGKAPYTGKIVCTVWMICTSTFAYGDVIDPLKMYRGKDYVETFLEHNEDEIKQLHVTFQQQPMRELIDVLTKGHEAVKNVIFLLKSLMTLRKVKDQCYYTGLYRRAAHNNCNLKYRLPDHIPIVFQNLSDYDVHLFIKKRGKKFNKDDIGLIAEKKEKYISFKVKINVKLTEVTNKDGKEVRKNIQLRFIDNSIFMASCLDEPANNLCDASGIKCGECKDDMELLNIFSKYIALLHFKRYETKKTKDLDKSVLKKNFNHTSMYWGCDGKFRLMIRKGVYPY